MLAFFVNIFLYPNIYYRAFGIAEVGNMWYDIFYHSDRKTVKRNWG